MFNRVVQLLLAVTLVAASGTALSQSGQIPSGTLWGNATANQGIATATLPLPVLDRGGATGTTGHKLPYLDGTNTWTATQILPASSTLSAGFRLPPGVAPTSPVNGDIWTTSAAVFAQVNGVTQQFVTILGSTTFYVRTDGNNSNPGTSNTPSGAFRTIQHAWDVIAGGIGSSNVTIQVGNGSYPEALACPAVLGAGTVTLLGDAATPSNVEIGSVAFTDVPITCNNIGRFVFNGFRLTSSNRLFDFTGTTVTATFGVMEFNTQGAAVGSSGRAALGATLIVTGTISIVRVAASGSTVFVSNAGGIIVLAAGIPVLDFPTSLGSGVVLFQATTQGIFQINTGTTFSNAANWQGIGVNAIDRGFVQGNITRVGFPGGTDIRTDGTTIIKFDNVTVNAGIYFSDPIGSLAWLGTSGFTQILAASANTASRTYTFPDLSGTVALTQGSPSIAVGANVAGDSTLTVNQNTAATVAPAETAALHLTGADSIALALAFDSFGQSNNIDFRRANGTLASKTVLTTGNPTIANLNMYGWDGTAYAASGALSFRAAETWSNTAHGTDFYIFLTSKTTTTVINPFKLFASGGLSVGTTAVGTDPGAGAILAGGSISATLANTATTSAVCYNTGTGLFTYNSTVGTCTVSTMAAKNLIDYLTPQDGLDLVMAMKPIRYTLKEGLPTFTPGEQIGMAAEYADEIDPRVVAHDPDGKPSGFRYEQYTAALTAAIHKLHADNQNMRACQSSWKCRLLGWQ